MEMWEAISAIATLGTGFAIVFTVLLGVRQIRMTAEQIHQLGRATQLDGTMRIFDDLLQRGVIAAMAFAINKLPELMRDPEFRAGLPLIQEADDNVHKELVVLRYFERVGSYVKYNLVDGTIIYDILARHIIEQWNALRDIVLIHRAAKGRGMWENFELLYDGSIAFAMSHGAGYLTVADASTSTGRAVDVGGDVGATSSLAT